MTARSNHSKPLAAEDASAPESHQSRGLSLSPVERLRWLDQAKQDFGRLLGRAKTVRDAKR